MQTVDDSAFAAILTGLAATTSVEAPVLVVAFGDAAIHLVLGDMSDATSVRQRWTLPFGFRTLHEEDLESDPPRPEELTNAIARVADHVDDVIHEQADVASARTIVVVGEPALVAAAVELGTDEPASVHGFALSRDAAEDVFRTLATEPLRDRVHNPGLAREAAEASVAGCLALVAVMRRLHTERVVVARVDEHEPPKAVSQ